MILPPSFSPCLLAFSLGPWWGKSSRQGVCDRKNYYLMAARKQEQREKGAVDKTCPSMATLLFSLQWLTPSASLPKVSVSQPHTKYCFYYSVNPFVRLASQANHFPNASPHSPPALDIKTSTHELLGDIFRFKPYIQDHSSLFSQRDFGSTRCLML